MKDKEIRRILVEWIQVRFDDVRIYQEKYIGNSICDVMAVTDHLIGFEIKSDADNFDRFSRQSRSYDATFDENYLVVGERQLKHALTEANQNWGILLVNDRELIVEREAKRNHPNRLSQLELLWKLELKNLLIRNNMPLYAQKSKDYIRERIIEYVPYETLGEQIARELKERDYSIFHDGDRTLQSNVPVPAQDSLIEILAEKDLEDYSLDQWISLYRKVKDLQTEEREVDKVPDTRLPHKIPYTDIVVSLGVPWVDKHIINEFAFHLLDQTRIFQIVDYEPITGNWFIHDKKRLGNGNVNAEVEYGLKRYNALQIMEASLNLREIKLYDHGKHYNERDTLVAIERQKRIEQEFERWVWEDEDRRWEIEEAYNNMFADYVPHHYDGSSLVFPQMNPEYTLYDYQKDAVQKVLETPNTLLAFDVGAGKTYIMIAAAMRMRQMGLSRKNMFVVPNHIVGQWEKIFTDLYPNAKVLAIEPKSFRPELRQKMLKQIQEGDYDGIIMAYSCFEMIPLSSKTLMDNIQADLDRIQEQLRLFRYGNERQALERDAKSIMNAATDLMDEVNTANPDNLTFEELEITSLFLDEAHNYKNLPIRTKMKNLNGVNTKGSKKCSDMLQKIRVVQNKGRGVVLATGTPLCNSIADAYTLQVYLQKEELQKNHLDVFDNWVRTFARPEQVFEIDVHGAGYRKVLRFSKFFNLPELSAMLAQVAVFYAMDGSDYLPDFDGYSDEVIERYPELASYMSELLKRTEKIRNKKVHPSADNMLKVSTDGRKAALDLTLVDREQPKNRSKTTACVRNVVKLYRDYPETTQLIFCDYSTPKGADFNVYQNLKSCLVEEGIPSEEIAFIHSFNTESKKLELFRRFNTGEVRILIGSTFKLGIGSNVQTRLKAIHHLDVPWRPADMVQREGRILRRGNENEVVQIYRYITEGSFDSYCWQILERKQRFISQFLSGSTYQRSAPDLEQDVLSYAEVKALALNEPLMKKLAEKENELQTLRILGTRNTGQLSELKKEQRQLEKKLPVLKEQQQISRENEQWFQTLDPDAVKQTGTMLSLNPLWDQVTREKILPASIDFLGFVLSTPEVQNEKKPFLCLERNGVSYSVELGDSSVGNVRRVTNCLKKLSSFTEGIGEEYANTLKRLDDIKSYFKTNPKDVDKQIASCEKEIRELRHKLDV